MKKINLEGEIFFNLNDIKAAGKGKIELLEKVDKLGSLSKAARELGINYKNAWDMLHELNNLSEERNL